MGERTASLLVTILATVIALSSSFRSSEAMEAGVYWGQGSSQMSLKAVCDSGLFNYVNLAHLTIPFLDRNPVLNLNGTTCGVGDKACLHIRDDILHCQAAGIKVLLSIQITGIHRQTISAGELVGIVIRHYLHGGDDNAPLGNVMLDGVTFHVEERSSPFYWAEVLSPLTIYRGSSSRKIILAAAPQCVFPDETLNLTIRSGVYDFVWVQFYNNATCDYSGGGVKNVLEAWNKWSQTPPFTKLFMGLPTSPDNVQSGYIPPLGVALCIQPKISTSPRFAGFMLGDLGSVDCVPDSEKAALIKMISKV